MKTGTGSRPLACHGGTQAHRVLFADTHLDFCHAGITADGLHIEGAHIHILALGERLHDHLLVRQTMLTVTNRNFRCFFLFLAFL